jgi:hypothetical protein
MNCILSEPVNLGTGGSPNWAYSKITCDSLETYPSTSTFFTIEHPTSTTGNFVIEKKYTYGDITSILLSGAIFLTLIFYILKRLFFHDEVSIHSYQTKF